MLGGTKTVAIVVCKKCGKNISDTVDTCIHCGALISELTEDKNSNQESTENDFINNEIDENKEKGELIDYRLFDQDQRIELEKQFLQSDKRAMNYMRKNIESVSYMRIFMWFFYPYLLSHLFTEKILSFIDAPVYDDILNIIGSLLLIILGMILMICFIYSVVHQTKIKFSNKKYYYMKKFQKWLKEEKNIDYYPPFVNIKEKEKFDKIDINLYDYYL